FDRMLTRTLVQRGRGWSESLPSFPTRPAGHENLWSARSRRKGKHLRKELRNLLADWDRLASIVLPMLVAWRGIRARAAELGRQLVPDARQSRACRIHHRKPPLPRLLRSLTTSGNPDLSARGSA